MTAISQNGLSLDGTSLELNRYFLGKFLSPHDFECEQRYFRQRRWLGNQALFGAGIVSGLVVSWSRENDGTCCLHVSPGMAIDYLGREVIISQEDCRPFKVSGAGRLVIRFRETHVDPVPALAHEQDEPETDMVMNRILETPEIQFIHETIEEATSGDIPPDKYNLFLARLIPHCQGREGTPQDLDFAAISDKEKIYTVNHFGRKYVVRDPHDWPIITGYNWQHGGALVADSSDKILIKIYFSHPIKFKEEYAKDRLGLIQIAVFLDGNLDRMLMLKTEFSEGRTLMTAQIPEDIFDPNFSVCCGLELSSGCLTDELGRALDGAMLGPDFSHSGNGVPGSNFKSWFSLALKSDTQSLQEEQDK